MYHLDIKTDKRVLYLQMYGPLHTQCNRCLQLDTYIVHCVKIAK